MKIFKLTVINLKRLIKNPVMLSFGVLLPIIVLMTMGGNHTVEKEKIIIVDEDKSEYSQMLISEIQKNKDIKILDNGFDDEEAIDEGWNAAITIKSGYQEKIKNKKLPEVLVHSLNGGSLDVISISNEATTSLLEQEILGAKLDENISIKIIRKESLPLGLMSLLMIIYYGFITTAMITDDLMKLKAQNVLKRAITTPNRSYEVLIGSFLSAFIFLSMSMCVTYTLVKETKMLEGVVAFNGYISVILASFVFVAITIFTVRWFKKPEIVSGVVTFTGLGLFLIGIIGIMVPYLPESVSYLGMIGYISPFYWVGEIAKGNLVSGVVVLLLMGIAIFTTGTYKISEFASSN